MISGIKLPEKPYMNGVTFEDIMADLDLLKERVPEESYTNMNGVFIRKRTFIGEKYVTALIDYDKEDFVNYKALHDLYKIITTTIPDFCVSYPYSETILLFSYPNFKYPPVFQVFERLMEEFQRVTVFLIKNFGIENNEYIKFLLKDYVNLCVDYPNK